MTESDKINLRDYLDDKFDAMGREVGQLRKEVGKLQEGHVAIAGTLGEHKATLKGLSDRVERVASNGHDANGKMQALIAREDERSRTQETQHEQNSKGLGEVRDEVRELKEIERSRGHHSDDDDDRKGGGGSSDDAGVVRMKQPITLKDIGILAGAMVSLATAVAYVMIWAYSRGLLAAKP